VQSIRPARFHNLLNLSSLRLSYSLTSIDRGSREEFRSSRPPASGALESWNALDYSAEGDFVARKPRIFVGYSSDQEKLVRSIVSHLKQDAEVIPWPGLFQLSHGILEDLVAALREVDYAIFVFAPVDPTSIKGKKQLAVRDNVVFELGLFMGHLGRDRCFILKPQQEEDARTLSDLHGILTAPYLPGSDASLAKACDRVLKQIRTGPRKSVAALTDAIAGEWIEIKNNPGKDRPYALVNFSKNDQGNLVIRGHSYDRNGTRQVTWPSSDIDFHVIQNQTIIHCFGIDHHSPDPSQAYGLTKYTFDEAPPGGTETGSGFYAVFAEGGMEPNRVEFSLRKASPEFTGFLLGRRRLVTDEDRSQFVRAVDRIYGRKRVVLTGGSCAGKTSLLKKLRKLDNDTISESAISVIKKWKKKLGGSKAFAAWRAKHNDELQLEIFEVQKQAEARVHRSEMVFLDRSGIDCIGYGEELGGTPSAGMELYARESKFHKIFVLETLKNFKARKKSGRLASREESVAMGKSLHAVYHRFGYDPVFVPCLPIRQRLAMILKELQGS